MKQDRLAQINGYLTNLIGITHGPPQQREHRGMSEYEPSHQISEALKYVRNLSREELLYAQQMAGQITLPREIFQEIQRQMVQLRR